jgi:T5SS/PEP-CTERM-associated repeat protein/autotransporter-associated beta strand protein
VGLNGAGNSLTISNGGKVENTTGTIGSSSTSSNNSVLVTGTNSLWTNSSTLGVGNAGGGTLTVANGGNVAASGITFAANAGSTGTLNIGRFGTNDTAGTINAATIAFGSGTGAINFNQSDSTTISAAISGSGSVNQLGNGTTTLSGANTYSGTTTVNAGTFLANNTTGSAMGSSAVTVNSGGTLGGNGTIDGATTIASGGKLTPGSSGTGALSFSAGLTLESGSITTFLIESTGDFTSINILGNTITYGGGLVFNIASYTPVAGDVFTLFNMTGSATQSGDFSSVTAGSLIFTESGGIWSASYGDFAYQFSQSTGQLSVEASQAVPEPSTYALFGIGAIVMMMVMRRKKTA